MTENHELNSALEDLRVKVAVLEERAKIESRAAQENSEKISDINRIMHTMHIEKDLKEKRSAFFYRNWRFFASLAVAAVPMLVGLYEFSKFLLFMPPPK